MMMPYALRAGIYISKLVDKAPSNPKARSIVPKFPKLSIASMKASIPELRV